MSEKKGLYLSKIAFGGFLVGGLSIILIVGLLCGLVIRPKNCIDPSTTLPSTTKTETTSRLSTGTRTLPSLSTASTNPSITTGPPPSNIRLPDYLVPSNYNLELKVFFNPVGEDSSNDRFEGLAVIDFEMTKASNRIVLHIDNTLTVSDTLEVENLQSNQVMQINKDNFNYLENQLFEIVLPSEQPKGNYRLKINYSGNYGPVTNIIGFYKTKYTEDGLVKNLVATKFQPTDARKAFPCFDEPALKASFEITIEHPMGTFALSNWPEQVLN